MQAAANMCSSTPKLPAVSRPQNKAILSQLFKSFPAHLVFTLPWRQLLGHSGNVFASVLFLRNG